MPRIVQVPDDSDTTGVQDSPKPKPVKARLISVPIDEEPTPPSNQTISRFSDVPQGVPPKGYNAYEDAISFLPAVGGMLGDLPGAIAGSFARQALSRQPSLGQAGTDIALQGVAPSLVGRLLESSGLIPKIAAKLTNSNNPTIAEGLANIMDKFKSSNVGPIDVAAEQAKSHPIESYLDASNPDRETQFPGNRPGQQLLRRPDNPLTEASNQTYKQIIDTALSDVQHVRNFKLATGDSSSIEQLAMNKAISKGYSAGGKIDSDAILKELGGPNKDIYDEAIGPEAKNRLTAFLNKAKSFEPSSSGSTIMSYTKHRLLFDFAAGAFGGGLLSHGVEGAVAGGGALVLGSQAISKLMQSDFMGKLALKSLETPINSQLSPLVTKTILTGLRGTLAYMQMPDGKQQPVQIGNDGQIMPLKTQ